MSDLSLYRLCLEKVSLLLEGGCELSIPLYYIRDLVTVVLRRCSPYSFEGTLTAFEMMLRGMIHFKTHNNLPPKVLDPSSLGLQGSGGRLTHLTLSRILFREKFAPVVFRSLKVLCSDLQVLGLTHIKRVDEDQDVSGELTRLLESCTRLEELHCGLPFDLKVLRNHKRLRSLRLCVTPRQPLHDFLEVRRGSHVTLTSLSLFDICQSPDSTTCYQDLSVILRHCPGLTCMGFLETALPLAHMEGSAKGGSEGLTRPLQLRKCLWRNRPLPRDVVNLTDFIRVAASACPLVEVLQIEVDDPYFLRHLAHLRNLSSLSLRLSLMEHKSRVRGLQPTTRDDRLSELYSVLAKVGPQLRHLAVRTDGPAVAVNAVYRSCPNLESLHLFCAITLRHPLEPASLPRLQSLRYSHSHRCDHQRDLLYLLSKCTNVTRVTLSEALPLDDGLLNVLLSQNPLSSLREARISFCSLSAEGLGKFLRSARNLETLDLTSTRMEPREVERVMGQVQPGLARGPNQFEHLRALKIYVCRDPVAFDIMNSFAYSEFMPPSEPSQSPSLSGVRSPLKRILKTS